MKKDYFAKASLGCLLCLLIFLAGCIHIGSWPMLAKYERQVQLSAPLAPGSVFTAQTHNGSITITGANVADCNLTATIIARAATEEAARKLAEQVKIKLQASNSRLTVKIQKPAFMTNQSVSVNLDVTVPEHSDAEITTHNGAVRITNITGQVNATTHNGSATAKQVSGTIKLETHNGSVTCKEISGDTNLRTHNGKINAAYYENAPAIFNASMVTHNGSIDFTAPLNLSATVDLSTHNGSINTDLPITIIGKVTKRKLTGTIGTGEGKLHLETHNGSIKIN